MTEAHEQSALDVGLALARKLREKQVPYALGGALALNASGILRSTRDVDINVFVAPGELAPVFDSLREMGVSLDEPRAIRAALDEGMFAVWVGPWRIDIFTPSIDFSWKAQATRVEHRVEGEPIAFLSPEALAVFKLLFFRSRDLGDLEQLVALRDDLDIAWIRRELVQIMGGDDPRVEAWDRIVSSSRR